MVQGLGLRVEGIGVEVQGARLRVSGFGFRVLRCRLKVENVVVLGYWGLG